jgi:2-succinyl-6-hydroxy-2,4-cyclohexadiene-1-carboxylate synthase
VITDLSHQFSVDGVTLAWDRWGQPTDSPPLLLCHGFSGSAHDFALSIADLAEAREVLSLDHRGHGRSTKLGAVEPYSIDRLAHDLIALIDAEAGGPVDLLGHSMGGAIALRVTLARPDLVRSLVLMDTSGWSFVPPDSPIAAMMSGFIAAFDPAAGLPDLSAMPNPEKPLIEAATPAEWQERKLQMDTAFDPYALKSLGAELFSDNSQWIKPRLGEITCPVTVIVGEHDHPFIDQAEELAAAVSDGRLTVIAGAYHQPQLTHRAEWTAAVEGHLARTV